MVPFAWFETSGVGVQMVRTPHVLASGSQVKADLFIRIQQQPERTGTEEIATGDKARPMALPRRRRRLVWPNPQPDAQHSQRRL
jgi:hypothetical protein